MLRLGASFNIITAEYHPIAPAQTCMRHDISVHIDALDVHIDTNFSFEAHHMYYDAS
jgi:hypothetical protein